jgi:rhombotail lipoprotein
MQQISPTQIRAARTGVGLMAALMCTLLLSSCADSRGFDREDLRTLLQQDGTPEADRSTAPAATARPASQGPFRLAMYFVDREFPAHHTTRHIDWLSADKDLVTTMLAPLQTEQILTETFLLVDSTIRGNDARRIRQAGARYGADLIVTFDGVAAVDRYNNRKASLLYWTILGAYVADGTQSDALSVIRASILDVKSGLLLASHEAEGHAETVGPAAFVDDRATIEQAKKQALEQLGHRIAEQLKRWKRPS